MGLKGEFPWEMGVCVSRRAHVLVVCPINGRDRICEGRVALHQGALWSGIPDCACSNCTHSLVSLCRHQSISLLKCTARKYVLISGMAIPPWCFGSDKVCLGRRGLFPAHRKVKNRECTCLKYVAGMCIGRACSR